MQTQEPDLPLMCRRFPAQPPLGTGSAACTMAAGGCMRLVLPACLALLAALAGCSEFGFFRPKLDPNAYPASYRGDLLAYVRLHPVDILDARQVSVSTPTLKQVGADNR